MKFFLLAILAVAAVVAEPEAKPEAEAKPQHFGYNTYSPYTYGAYSPYTAYASTYSSPYYGYGRVFGKREAESDPQYYSYGYNAYSPYTYGAYGAYSAYSSPYYSYGRVFGKREAEADSKPELVYTDGTFHTNVANLQKGVNNQYVKPYGAVYNSVPVAYQQPAVAYAAAPVAATPFVTGYSRLYKREAEPQYYSYGSYSPYTYGYSSYGSYPYSYGSYGYGGYGSIYG